MMAVSVPTLFSAFNGSPASPHAGPLAFPDGGVCATVDPGRPGSLYQNTHKEIVKSCSLSRLPSALATSRLRMQPKCPQHDTPLVLRRNAKTGEVSLACISCDVEARGGGEEEARLIFEAMKSKEPAVAP